MELSNRMWKVFKFTFMPSKFQEAYPKEMQFSKQNFPPELLAGTSITKLHVQAGDRPPPPEYIRKSKGTPTFKTSVMGATLTIFKLGILLMCHLHLPVGANGEAICDNIRDRLFYTVFNEFRLLRVPTEFHISIDEVPGAKDDPFPTRTFMEKMGNTAKKIQQFNSPHDRCDFPTQQYNTEEVDIFSPDCHCLACIRNLNPEPPFPQPGAVNLFQGDINSLVGGVISSRSSISLARSSISTASGKDRERVIISNFTAMEEDEIDIPLDPLGMTDDNEIHEFLTTDPGCEEEDYEPTGSDPLP
jgi:hypothetical protein